MRRTLISVTALIAALGLAACSDSDSESSETPPPASSQTQAPASSQTGPPASTEGRAPAPVERPCPRGIPEGLVERVTCGRIPVPLSHDDPAGERIMIAFARIRAEESAGPEGVIVLGGGPGEKIVGSVAMLRPDVPLLLLARTRDVVLIDQRGIGESRPALDCEADPRSVAVYVRQVGACLARLKAEGNDLAAYDTLADARDLDLVRQALGFERVDLFGTSYGARLAHQALRGNPSWVRSVILSSPYPPQFNGFAEGPASFAAALRTTFRACEANRECARRFPNLAQRLDAALRRLIRRPAPVSVRNPETGRMVRGRLDAPTVASLLFGLYYRPDAAKAVPTAIAKLAEGDAQSLVTGPSPISADAISIGAQYAFICQEEGAYFGRSPQARARNLPLAAKLLAASSPVVGTPSLEICRRSGLPRADPLTFERVTSDTPALIFGGLLDQITPIRYARQAAEDLSRSTLVVVPVAGHSPLNAIGPCGYQIAAAFLDDPESEPDTGCLRRLLRGSS